MFTKRNASILSALLTVVAVTAVYPSVSLADEILLSTMRTPSTKVAPAPAVQPTNVKRAQKGAAKAKKRVSHHSAGRPSAKALAGAHSRPLKLSQSSREVTPMPTSEAHPFAGKRISSFQPNVYAPNPYASGEFVRRPSSSATPAKPVIVAENDVRTDDSLVDQSTAAVNRRRTRKSGAGNLPQNFPSNPQTSQLALPDTKPAVTAAKIPGMMFSINNEYDGSTIRDLTAGYQPAHDSGYDSESVALLSTISLGYHLTDNLSLAINPQFATTANGRTYNDATQSYDASEGRFMQPMASYVSLGVSHFVPSGKIFSWSGDFRYYAPITDDLKGAPDPVTGEYKNQYHYLRTDQVLNWQVDKKWSVGSFNALRYYVRPSAFAEGKSQLKIEFEPYVNYAISDKLAVGLPYDMYMQNSYGNFGTFGNKIAFFEPNIDWKPGYGFELIPYMRVYTGDHPNLDTTSWGAYILWTIL